ncbi:condensation domain-containing protein [Streptomyces sp. WG-D5]
MTTDHSSHSASARPAPGAAMTVVVAPPADAAAPPVLELRGPLDPQAVEAALDRLDRLAARPGPAWRPRLLRVGPGHHHLHLTPVGARPGAAEAPFPAGLLADLLTVEPAGPGAAARVEPTPLQRELLADADAHPGTEGWCEQLALTWRGPLDAGRLAAAWQSVADRESVLRAAFEDGPEPWIVCHDGTGPEVLRFPHGSVEWQALVEADRRRGVDPRRPGPLRVTVLEGGTDTARVLLSFHPALLDDWSARLLLHEFYRAYLAGGALRGGARRPDHGDHARWHAAQDPAPAQEFWQAEPPGPATRLPGADGQAVGAGQVRARLTPEESERLRVWAAGQGCPESSALYAVWALALYRAGAGRGPATVRFSATVPGRGIPLDGVERLPAALRNPLPMTAGIDPAAPLTGLLRGLRDQSIDVSAYEWVSEGTTHPGRPTGAAPRTGTLVHVERRPQAPEDLAPGLAALGVRVSGAETLGARTGFPVTLVAHRDDDGALLLTATCLGAAVAGAGHLLARAAHALRELPGAATPSTTVGQALALLAGPGRAPRVRPAARRPSPLVELRPAADPGAGTVCLVRAPGTPLSSLTRVAYAYQGPEAVVLLRPPPYADAATPARALADLEGPLVLGALCGGGDTAYALARSLAATRDRPPGVVLTGTTAPPAGFARALEAVARRTR